MPGIRKGEIPEERTANITTKIQIEAEETADAFIFSIVKPFCERIFELQKKDLEQALIHYFPKKRIKHPYIRESQDLKETGCDFQCPTCFCYINSKQTACDNCGQRLEVEHGHLPDLHENETF